MNEWARNTSEIIQTGYITSTRRKTRTLDPLSTTNLWTKWLFTVCAVHIFNGYNDFENDMRSWKCWRLPTEAHIHGTPFPLPPFRTTVVARSFPSYQSGRTAPGFKQAACIIMTCLSIESCNCLFFSLCAIIIQIRWFTKVFDKSRSIMYRQAK
jgi:hypothetical protein